MIIYTESHIWHRHRLAHLRVNAFSTHFPRFVYSTILFRWHSKKRHTNILLHWSSFWNAICECNWLHDVTFITLSLCMNSTWNRQFERKHINRNGQSWLLCLKINICIGMRACCVHSTPMNGILFPAKSIKSLKWICSLVTHRALSFCVRHQNGLHWPKSHGQNSGNAKTQGIFNYYNRPHDLKLMVCRPNFTCLFIICVALVLPG